MAEEPKDGDTEYVQVVAEAPGRKVLAMVTDTGLQMAEAREVSKEHPAAAGAEVFQLHKTEEPGIYEKRTLNRKGPVKVNSHKFRQGWEGIFGKPQTDETLN